MKALDLSEHQFVVAFASLVGQYRQIQPLDDEELLDCLCYLYACVQRDAKSGIHPSKLN